MKKQKMNKGITLIALVITIIVLLILAAVSISTLTGENGILTKASTAKENTEREAAKEKVQMAILASYGTDGKIDNNSLKTNLDKVEGIKNVPATITDSDFPLTVTVDGYEVIIDKDGNVTAKGEKNEGTENPSEEIPEMYIDEAMKIEKFERKTKVIGLWSNQVIVPAGFKIADDSSTYVPGGFVIEDATDGPTKGSQFVWIPVGTINCDLVPGNDTRTIELSRYTFATDGTPTAHGEASIGDGYTYYEELATSSYGNTTAKNINEFKTSVQKNGGYYIGRYEARTPTKRTNGTDDSALGQVTVKADDYVYNYATQPQAAKLSREMYQNTGITSDLVNSYAWDTALVFIQKCGLESNYSNQKSINNNLAEKGTNNLSDTTQQDQQCGIWDMASNFSEWSTETATTSDCVITRGGAPGYLGPSSERYNRNLNTTAGFRVILYL